MFKWLFGKGASEAGKRTDTIAESKRFEGAQQMVLKRATALKQEYDRTGADSEITQNIEAYKDPTYIAGVRDAIFSSVRDRRQRGAHEILPAVATMFMTMANEAFPSHHSFETFSH
jgi:hypothetical protein